VTPEASFNLTADVLHYFEVGVKLVSAPLGNFRITVGEAIGETNFMAYVSYGIPPTPYLNPELHQRLVDYLRNRMQGVTTRFRWIGA
jgi:hypothetical protein